MTSIKEKPDADVPGRELETVKPPFQSGTTNTGTVSQLSQESIDREGFGNSVEFVLTCLGLAFGLGNIWRFPTRAYENGGSAFLIPYLIFGLIFGLPTLYMEFLLGQYQGKSPPIVFRRIMPILEGLGWMGVCVSAVAAVYYVLLIAWILIYLVNIFRGDFTVWNKCDNEWNMVDTCIDMLQTKQCQTLNSTKNVYFIGGKCQDADLFSNVSLTSATEQYFLNHIVGPSGSIFDFQGVNWQVLMYISICWIITALALVKGTKIIGKISYVSVLLPLVIFIILFIRSVTLEGASTGLYYYLGQPDYGKLLKIKTWTEALKQLSFSLSLGQGTLMNFASYSRKHNNVFRDAILVLIGDTLMSLIGGAIVFSTLGFLAVQRGVTIPEVIESDMSLTFVVYPEAMSQMHSSWLWGSLFFMMLFLLAVSSQIALVEVFCSCLYDQNVSLSRKKWLVVPLWCLFLYLFGFVFSTKAGVYWFKLFDEFSTGFSSVCSVLLEVVVVMYFYGFRHFKMDITETLGEPRNGFTSAIGPHSPFFIASWMVIGPIIAVTLVVLSFTQDYPFQNTPDVYPLFSDLFGWSVAFLPVLLIPIFMGINFFRFRSRGISSRCLFMLQKQHPSYQRVSLEFSKEQRELQALLPDKEPWDEEPDDSYSESAVDLSSVTSSRR